MDKKINFAIIGTGRIARKFATGLQSVKDANLMAVGSRKIETAREFADEFQIERAYGSYKELAQDKDIDVVYISTPNYYHMEHTILCLENKKAVICEKPFGANKSQVKKMIETAKKNNVFLMEAMWTRFFPLIAKIRELIDEGIIGNIRMIKGDFGFKSNIGYDDIRFSKDLAGGSLMDVGIYPISFSSMIYKKQPVEIKSVANIGKTGVDEQAAIIFQYDKGEMALLSSAIKTQTPRNMFIIGEEGYIHIPDVWYAQEATLKLNNQDEQIIKMPIEGNGYNYEAMEVIDCLRKGKLESSIMPLQESLDIIETLDKIRKQWGMEYPFEV